MFSSPLQRSHTVTAATSSEEATGVLPLLLMKAVRRVSSFHPFEGIEASGWRRETGRGPSYRRGSRRQGWPIDQGPSKLNTHPHHPNPPTTARGTPLGRPARSSPHDFRDKRALPSKLLRRIPHPIAGPGHIGRRHAPLHVEQVVESAGFVDAAHALWRRGLQVFQRVADVAAFGPVAVAVNGLWRWGVQVFRRVA